MELKNILQDISAGILVTDDQFKVIWANKFEEDFYNTPLEEMAGLYVVDCHKEENRAKIADFLKRFKEGELKEFSKTKNGMVITYSSYHDSNGKFSGIVRSRIRLPK